MFERGELVKMNLDEVIRLIKNKWEELIKGERWNFKDFVTDNWGPQRGKLEHAGVYVIYEGNEPIYVGSAGKGKHVLKYRICDLFGFSPGSKTDPYYHPLTKKLIEKEKRFEEIDEVRRYYLDKCSFKYVKTDNVDQARMLEQAFILLSKLRPKYNE